jgi:hypothetical protein
MWALLFIVAAPSDYTIHSTYATHEQCFKAEQRYVSIFEQTGSKLKTRCVLKSRVPPNKESTLVIKKYVLP